MQEYNSDAPSLRVAPNCEHCKNLQDYITICEEAANTLRQEIAQRKQQASSTRPPATPTSPPATQPKTTKERIKKTQKPKISFVGDSNARNLYRHLDSTKTDNAVWVNAGCKIEDVNSRVHHMIKDNDIGVLPTVVTPWIPFWITQCRHLLLFAPCHQHAIREDNDVSQ